MDLWSFFWGPVLAVGIAVFSFWFGRRNKQRPDLRYALDFDEVLSPGDALLESGLDLSFRGARIERLCRTYIAVWQRSGDTVRREDRVESDPVRLEFATEDKILQARVVAYSRAAIALTPKMGEAANIVELDFDFFDAGDGAVLEILHHTAAAPVLRGSIRGAAFTAVERGVTLTAAARSMVRDSRAHRLRQIWTGVIGKTLLMLAILGLLAGVCGVLFMFVGVRALAAPQVLDPNEYDLSFLAGQVRFAMDVDIFTGWGSLAAFAVAVSMLGAALAVGRLFWRITRAVIPRSVVRHEVQGAALLGEIADSGTPRTVGDFVTDPERG